MRLQGFSATNVLPIDRCEVGSLSDLVVLAGPNGVGKTQLINYILNAFRSPGQQSVVLLVEPTNDEERKFMSEQESSNERGMTSSDTPIGQLFIRKFLTANRRRHYFRSGVLYYESNRSIQNVQPLAFQFEFNDPFEELVGWDMGMQPLSSR
jgi:ABC-type cobalamin/Fe3+-siderophores transport system ATPase subunit